jgi:hypothetical protein
MENNQQADSSETEQQQQLKTNQNEGDQSRSNQPTDSSTENSEENAGISYGDAVDPNATVEDYIQEHTQTDPSKGYAPDQQESQSGQNDSSTKDDITIDDTDDLEDARSSDFTD